MGGTLLTVLVNCRWPVRLSLVACLDLSRANGSDAVCAGTLLMALRRVHPPERGIDKLYSLSPHSAEGRN